MVLVDTSVWIRFLANRAPYAAELARLVGLAEVTGHELVYMHRAETIPHRDVVEFVRSRGLHGRGVGWIDVHLLACAIVGRLHLWTADTRVAVVANELGIAYDMPAGRRGE